MNWWDTAKEEEILKKIGLVKELIARKDAEITQLKADNQELRDILDLKDGEIDAIKGEPHADRCAQSRRLALQLAEVELKNKNLLEENAELKRQVEHYKSMKCEDEISELRKENAALKEIIKFYERDKIPTLESQASQLAEALFDIQAKAACRNEENWGEIIWEIANKALTLYRKDKDKK